MGYAPNKPEYTFEESLVSIKTYTEQEMSKFPQELRDRLAKDRREILDSNNAIIQSVKAELGGKLCSALATAMDLGFSPLEIINEHITKVKNEKH